MQPDDGLAGEVERAFAAGSFDAALARILIAFAADSGTVHLLGVRRRAASQGGERRHSSRS